MTFWFHHSDNVWNVVNVTKCYLCLIYSWWTICLTIFKNFYESKRSFVATLDVYFMKVIVHIIYCACFSSNSWKMWTRFYFSRYWNPKTSKFNKWRDVASVRANLWKGHGYLDFLTRIKWNVISTTRSCCSKTIFGESIIF